MHILLPIEQGKKIKLGLPVPKKKKGFAFSLAENEKKNISKKFPKLLTSFLLGGAKKKEKVKGKKGKRVYRKEKKKRKTQRKKVKTDIIVRVIQNRFQEPLNLMNWGGKGVWLSFPEGILPILKSDDVLIYGKSIACRVVNGNLKKAFIGDFVARTYQILPKDFVLDA